MRLPAEVVSLRPPDPSAALQAERAKIMSEIEGADRKLARLAETECAPPSFLMREITGEQIRDKVAASKRKGIWMGGAVPLAYRVEDRALHVVEDEAEFVRALFRRYLEIGSVVRLKTASTPTTSVRRFGSAGRAERPGAT